MKFISLLCSVFLISSAMAKGGDFAGNGGDGVRLDGHLYSLDLFEAGRHTTPFLKQYSPELINTSFQDARDSLEIFPSAAQDMVIRKLLEIQEMNPLLSFTLAKAISMFEWNAVETQLLNIADEDTPLNIDPNLLEQLAIRKGESILVDRKKLSELNDVNAAALVFHEMIYALSPFEKMENPDFDNGADSFRQSSFKAREIVGYMFGPSFQKKGLMAFNRKMESFFPDGKTAFAFRIEPDGNILISKNATYKYSEDVHDYSDVSYIESAFEESFVGLCKDIEHDIKTSDEDRSENDIKENEAKARNFRYSPGKIRDFSLDFGKRNGRSYLSYSWSETRFGNLVMKKLDVNDREIFFKNYCTTPFNFKKHPLTNEGFQFVF